MTFSNRTLRSVFTGPTVIPGGPRRSQHSHSQHSPPSSPQHPPTSRLPDVSSPVIWRFSPSSSSSSHRKHSVTHAPPLALSPANSPANSPPNSSAMTNSKPYFSPLRLALVAAILIYIFVPSHILTTISSHPGIASVSDAGKRVFQSIQSTVNPSSAAAAQPPPPPSQLNSLAATPACGPGATRGVSIVAACKNRHENLRKVLPSWLAVRHVHQVVLVDWSSTPPLHPTVSSALPHPYDPRLKLVRVDAEPSWVLSRAYNLAVAHASCPYILRTDCDYALHQDILSVHSVNETDSSFFSGNWRQARNDDETHLNGALIVKRDVFLSVGGYDERIQTYGWDDEDLYTRLESQNLTRRTVDYNYVTHTPHDDATRAQAGVKFAQVQIDLNRILSSKLPPWSKSMLDESSHSSSYEVLGQTSIEQLSGDDNSAPANYPLAMYIQVKAEHVPASLQQLLPKEEVDNAWLLALGRRLAGDYQIPWDVMMSMNSNMRESLLRKMLRLQDELDELAANGNITMTVRRGKIVPLPTKARVIIVHCQHGLGNRLRALGSALAFAKYAKRIPIVMWEPDAHIAAEFTELFEIQSRGENNEKDLVVASKFNPKWPFARMNEFDSAWANFKLYNYMEMEPQSKKQEVIENDVDKHIYYKGAYIMEAWDYTWWESTNEQLRNLVPVSTVRDRLAELEQRGVRQAIGVHVRNKTMSNDIDAVDSDKEYGLQAAHEMEQWRRISCAHTFITEMKRIIAEEDADATFYIASDTWQVLDIMESTFPGRVLSVKRDCDDREVQCVLWAVVDLYALGYTKRLLGSNWSSYTEAAQRIGGVKAKLSGVDFGPKMNVTLDSNVRNKQKQHNLNQKQRQKQKQS